MKKGCLIAAVVVVVILSLGLGYYFYDQSKKDPNVYDTEKPGFTFEKYCAIHKEAHTDLEDFNEPMPEDKKVRKLLRGIRAPNLQSAKNTIIATPRLNTDFQAAVDFIAHFINTQPSYSRQRNISGAVSTINNTRSTCLV